MFNDPVRYCGSTLNSTGQAALLSVSGSADEIDNDLCLVASHNLTDAPGITFE